MVRPEGAHLRQHVRAVRSQRAQHAARVRPAPQQPPGPGAARAGLQERYHARQVRAQGVRAALHQRYLLREHLRPMQNKNVPFKILIVLIIIQDNERFILPRRVA